AGQTQIATKRSLLHGAVGAPSRLIGPELVLPSLQGHGWRPAGAVPNARKNRLRGPSPAKKRQSVPLTIPHEQGESAWSRRRRGPIFPSIRNRSRFMRGRKSYGRRFSGMGVAFLLF